MKTVKSYILGFAAALSLPVMFTACQDDFDTLNVEIPVAANQANITIAELKEMYWQDAANYAETVGEKEDGTHYYISGRVISSDEQSNVFKFISLQDATGAINFSVNSYNLYLNYRRGQEIVVDVTGMHIGKYAGLQQFGTPTYYENGSTWQVGFMSPEFFRGHIELNGLPEVEKIDTVTINSFSELDSSPEGLRKWQSRIVRINNVHFQDGGVKTFSAYHSNDNDDVNRTLVDAEGNSNLVVRTSGYATFWNKMLPEGSGDIVGILSFYQSLSGSSTWQLILNDYEGCMNFGNPTIAKGSESNPYSVAEAVQLESDGTPASGWVTGYIVGTVASGVESVTKNEDIVWDAATDPEGRPYLPYTLVIGADKETKDIASALVIQLPADSPLRKNGNLFNNPGNYGKAISVRGTLAKVMDTYGVADNAGTTSEFKIEGVETGGGSVAEGDGTAASPYNASQAKAKAVENGSSSTDNVYVKGYIISGSINMTYGTGTWVIADNTEGTGDTFTLFGTYNTDNKKFTDENAVKVGDLVVAVGPIYNYNDKTPEMSKGHLVSINGDGGNENPGGGDESAAGSGTETDPYNCAKIIALNPTSTTEAVEKGVWAQGYIVGYIPTGGTTTTVSMTVFGTDGTVAASNLVIASSKDEKDYTKCVTVQLPTGSTFRSAVNLKDHPENLGKLLAVKGDVMRYCGAAGIKNGSAYKLDGGGDTPNPPAGDAIFTETFEGGSLGQFSTTVETSGSWTGWRANTNTPACAIANSYVGGTNEAATAWLISPAIDLSAATSASVKLEQAFGFYFPTTQESFCTLNIREKGGQWKQLTLTQFPTKGTGNWTSFAENTVDITAYAGKTVEIGFKYVNDGNQSIAWEIKNFSVIADAGSVNPGGGDEPGGGDQPGEDQAAAGTGTEADPYNCAKVISLNPTSKDTALEKGVWVKGYIIGYMPSNNTKPENTITTAEGCSVQTNLVIAPTPTEKDFTKCLPIQLPTETKAPGIRTALNLADNPGNLGKEILLKGDVILYCGAPGLKETSAYKFVE